MSVWSVLIPHAISELVDTAVNVPGGGSRPSSRTFPQQITVCSALTAHATLCPTDTIPPPSMLMLIPLDNSTVTSVVVGDVLVVGVSAGHVMTFDLVPLTMTQTCSPG